MSTPPKHTHIWLDPAEVAVLPTSGAAWDNLQKAVAPDPKVPDLKNQDDHTPVVLMAHGLNFMRTGNTRSRDLAQARCLQAIGTEAGGRALAISRNLLPLLVAADCVGQRTPAFVDWVAHVRKEIFVDGPKTMADAHIVRPNNWGTHAGASCLAAAMFLKDIDDLHLHADVWKEWLGEVPVTRSKFEWGDLSWQADQKHPVGINRKSALIQGHDVDGVLPDDQRRGGGFRWPPTKENYVWEALQGTAASGHLLYRSGFVPWAWGNKAISRAVRWLELICQYPAEGDDECTPWIVNYYCGTKYTAKSPASPAKCFGWTDWTHAHRQT